MQGADRRIHFRFLKWTDDIGTSVKDIDPFGVYEVLLEQDFVRGNGVWENAADGGLNPLRKQRYVNNVFWIQEFGEIRVFKGACVFGVLQISANKSAAKGIPKATDAVAISL